MLSSLVCLGRHTITGLLCTSGRQLGDWSADYRLFSQMRFDPGALFGTIRRGILGHLHQQEPLVVAMDDSLLKKSGTKIPGVAYRRDPLGPPFHINFVRAQRILQISAALPHKSTHAPARLIPIDFAHTPTASKPRKNSPPQAWQEYHRLRQELNLSRQGAARLKGLRQALEADEPNKKRALWVAVDGRFTNSTILKGLPDLTTLIGRVRADAKLYYPPEPNAPSQRGRKRQYGHLAPTPEALRKDPSIPWHTLEVFAAGKLHKLKIKTLAPLLWRTAGPALPLRLIAIAPLAYRPKKGSRLLYRKPAYLICTDPRQALQRIIQAYFWRWDIEVNFRDEKQLLGVGQAQVRNESSVEAAPALAVAAYAILLLAAAKAFGSTSQPYSLPPPKWRRNKEKPRASTSDLISHLRAELWGKALGQSNFSHFMHEHIPDTKPENYLPHLPSAVLYAVNS